MQAVCATSSVGVKGVSLARRTTAARPTCRPVVVCRAQSPVAKATAAAAAVPALLAAHPALALVDDRLGGEGTGRILGAQGGEIWAILIVAAVVWALYFVGGRDLGGDKGDDSGMTL